MELAFLAQKQSLRVKDWLLRNSGKVGVANQKA